MNIEFSPLKEEDIDAVIQLGEATPEFQTGTGTPSFYGRETLQRWTQSPNGVLFVAKENDQLAGFLLGQAMGGSRDAYINCTVVSPEYRGQGIAAELTHTAEEKFTELGCNHIFSVVREDNLAMLSLKKKLGYQIGNEPLVYVDKMVEPKT